MNKAIFWCLALASFISLFYLVSEILAPFFIAFIFAYLLQPVIDHNAKKLNAPRTLITSAIFLFFISFLVFSMMILLPIIYNQISAFIVKIPYYKKNLDLEINSLLSNLDHIDPEIGNKITGSVQTFINGAFSVVALAANNIWGYTLATINFFAIIALVPVILYYFLRDWQNMLNSAESILPVKGKGKIHEFFCDINQLLSAYIRGQLNICLILSLYYTLGLSFIGVDLALLLGIMTGFMIIIPFIGIFISLSLALISCYFTYKASNPIVYVLILFAVGYIIESYILVPKIIGGRIGLHPVWIIFAVFALGSLFGFVGILFAIPIAGIIKLLLGYLIEFYKSSKVYNE